MWDVARASRILMVGALSASMAAAQPSDPSVQMRMRDRLNISLVELSDLSSVQRYVSGSVLLSGGVVFGVAAFSSSQRAQAAGMGLVGGLLGAAGIVRLAISSDVEELAGLYLAMPETNPEELRARIRMGESYLERLAANASRNRLRAGYLGVGVGAASLLAYLTTTGHEPIFLVEGLFLTLLGSAEFYFRMPAEREFDNYKAWKDGLGPEAQARLDDLPLLDWGVAPLARGLALGFNLAF